MGFFGKENLPIRRQTQSWTEDKRAFTEQHILGVPRKVSDVDIETNISNVDLRAEGTRVVDQELSTNSVVKADSVEEGEAAVHNAKPLPEVLLDKGRLSVSTPAEQNITFLPTGDAVVYYQGDEIPYDSHGSSYAFDVPASARVTMPDGEKLGGGGKFFVRRENHDFFVEAKYEAKSAVERTVKIVLTDTKRVYSVKTFTGNVNADGLTGNTIIETKAGSTELIGHRDGSAAIKTETGDVTVKGFRTDQNEANASLDVRTDAGDVIIDKMSGALSIQTGSGNITVRDADINNSNNEVIKSEFGDIEIGVVNPDVKVVALTAGDIFIPEEDFTLTLDTNCHERDEHGQKPGYRKVEGYFGSVAPETSSLNLSSDFGTIVFKRLKKED